MSSPLDISTARFRVNFLDFKHRTVPWNETVFEGKACIAFAFGGYRDIKNAQEIVVTATVEVDGTEISTEVKATPGFFRSHDKQSHDCWVCYVPVSFIDRASGKKKLTLRITTPFRKPMYKPKEYKVAMADQRMDKFQVVYF